MLSIQRGFKSFSSVDLLPFPYQCSPFSIGLQQAARPVLHSFHLAEGLPWCRNSGQKVLSPQVNAFGAILHGTSICCMPQAGRAQYYLDFTDVAKMTDFMLTCNIIPDMFILLPQCDPVWHIHLLHPVRLEEPLWVLAKWQLPEPGERAGRWEGGSSPTTALAPT